MCAQSLAQCLAQGTLREGLWEEELEIMVDVSLQRGGVERGKAGDLKRNKSHGNKIKKRARSSFDKAFVEHLLCVCRWECRGQNN